MKATEGLKNWCNILNKLQVWKNFFFEEEEEEICIFIQQGCVKLVKSDSKDSYNTKDSISNKCFCL